MIRLFYKVHKWVGVGVGLILLMWIVTGMLIGGGGGGRPAEPPDYSRATVSPATAVAVAARSDSALGAARGVALEQIAGRLVYRVSAARGRAALVDAATGEPVVIGEGLAREIAASLAPGAAIGEVRRLEGHDGGFPRGALPAWRVVLADPAGTWVHLSRDGLGSSNTREQRRKAVYHDLHTFATLQQVQLDRRTIRVLFLVASVISIAVVVTGYYLSLPRRWRTFRRTPEET